jgi:hypothetical protein
VNGGGAYLTPLACSQACRNPNKSEWLIRKVERTASSQPAAYTARSTSASGPGRLQMVPLTGRHSQNSSASARLAAKTKVARSAGGGTTRVQARLNHGRAITVCWTANSDSSSKSMTTAAAAASCGPWSMPLGTPASAKKPTA